jgi:hypothetical protein
MPPDLRIVEDKPRPEPTELERRCALIADALRAQADLSDALSRATQLTLLLMAQAISDLPTPDADEPKEGV